MPKIYIELAKLLLITTFGRNSFKPLRSAIIRIFFAVACMSALGITLGRSLAKANLANGLPILIIITGITTVIFAISGFIFLSAGSITMKSSGSIVQKILIVLPLNKTLRYFTLVFPYSIMGIILLCLYLPLAIGLANSALVPATACIVAAIFATLASIGFVLLRFSDKAFIKSSIFVLMVTEMVWIFDQAIKSSNARISTLFLNAIIGMTLLVCAGFIDSYRNPQLAMHSGKSKQSFKTYPEWLIAQFWFVIKMLRNRRSQVAYGFCLFISLSMAISLHQRHQVSLAGVGWLMFGSVLACSYASDVRGLSRRFKTPEIVALNGIHYFMEKQLIATLLLNTVVALPLFIVVVLASPLSFILLLFYTIGIVTAGSVLGLLSSTLFVPQIGELGSQIFTAMIAFAGLFGLPKILKFSGLNLRVQTLVWLGIALICFLGAIVIEQIRRRNYKHAEA